MKNDRDQPSIFRHGSQSMRGGLLLVGAATLLFAIAINKFGGNSRGLSPEMLLFISPIIGVVGGYLVIVAVARAPCAAVNSIGLQLYGLMNTRLIVWNDIQSVEVRRVRYRRSGGLIHYKFGGIKLMVQNGVGRRPLGIDILPHTLGRFR